MNPNLHDHCHCSECCIYSEDAKKVEALKELEAAVRAFLSFVYGLLRKRGLTALEEVLV